MIKYPITTLQIETQIGDPYTTITFKAGLDMEKHVIRSLIICLKTWLHQDDQLNMMNW